MLIKSENPYYKPGAISDGDLVIAHFPIIVQATEENYEKMTEDRDGTSINDWCSDTLGEFMTDWLISIHDSFIRIYVLNDYQEQLIRLAWS